jgi:predicted MFS family arabinose efflux permease
MHEIAHPHTVFVLLPFLTWSAANFGLYTYIAAILSRHLSNGMIPALLLLFGAGGVIGNLLGGVLSDRFGVRRPTTMLLVALIVSFAAVEPAGRSLISAGAVMAGWAISMAALFTLQQRRAIAVNPARSNLMLELNNSALYLGAAIGSVIVGLFISQSSLAVAAPVSATMAGLALLLLLILPQPAIAADTSKILR